MSPRILNIESSGNLCSVAITGFEQTVFASSKPGQKHTEVILDLIDQCMRITQSSFEALEAIAFSAGPGAFTGLRCACGTAQGIGWASAKPLIPVCTLEAIAEDSSRALAPGQVVLAAIDARMQECYTAAWKKLQFGFEALMPPNLKKPSEISSLMAQFDVSGVCGNAFELFEIPVGVPVLSTKDCDATMISTTANRLYTQGQTVSAEMASPLYIRDNVALTIAERLAKKAAQ